MNSIEKTSIAMVAVLGGTIFFAYAVLSYEKEIRECREAASAAGFSDCEVFSQAKAAGISESSKWAEKQRQDRAAADERARERERAAKAKQDMQEQVAAIKAELSRNPASRMSIPDFTWKISGFGSVALISPTIENKNSFEVKDVVIECNFSAKSGTQLSTTSQTIFDTVKANSKRTFKEVNVGFIHSQSARASCQVNSAKRALLD
ncbi:hypothetical protein [Bradyrhizobium liaoningense]|uniref:hypothetical protein n=1 Tax=Bradyrhizobium liaoningense TaxID=43992 RepID=UPI001BA91AEB|nr:hypothetical protein [Bradyrhizobium liaoningense]MBR1170510.1 hypothetical protein [Bradyrhizobium liaoningense]